MNIFFCDLIGTYDGCEDDRSTKIKELILELQILINELKLEKLYMCFISSEKIEYILPYIEEINNFIKDTPISLGRNFSSDEVYKDNKVSKIKYHNKIDQIRSVCAENKIERLFYADDTYMNQKIVRQILNILYPSLDVVSFIPGYDQLAKDNVYCSKEKGIEGLITNVRNYNNSLKRKTLSKIS